MNPRQKFAYAAFGCALTIVGMLAASVLTLNLVASKDRFDEIVCRRLVVIGDKGETAVGLFAADNGGSIEVYNKSGKPVVNLFADLIFGGGNVNIHDGKVNVFNKEGKLAIVLYVTEEGGSISVSDKSGVPAAILYADLDSGNLWLHDAKD